MMISAARTAFAAALAGAVALSGAPALAQAAECRDEEVVITGGTARSAGSRVQTFSGTCGRKRVSLSLAGQPVAEVLVRSGNGARRYDASHAFVRRLGASGVLSAVRLNCPEFSTGLSAEIYSLVPTACAHRVEVTHLAFAADGGLVRADEPLVADPAFLRAQLAHDLERARRAPGR